MKTIAQDQKHTESLLQRRGIFSQLDLMHLSGLIQQ